MRIVALLLTTLLTACGPAADNTDSKTVPMKAEDTVFGDQVRALNKARAVEGTIQQQKADTDAKIDAETSSKPAAQP